MIVFILVRSQARSKWPHRLQLWVRTERERGGRPRVPNLWSIHGVRGDRTVRVLPGVETLPSSRIVQLRDGRAPPKVSN